MNGHQHRFHIEINSIEDFAAFVSFIRGDDLDDTKLKELAARLRTSTNAEQAAVDAAQPKK